MQARVALRNPKATSKAAGKSGRAAAAASAGGGGGVSSSPGLDSGWVLGAEVQVVVLELMAVAAPRPPINLLGKMTHCVSLVQGGQRSPPVTPLFPQHSCCVVDLSL